MLAELNRVVPTDIARRDICSFRYAFPPLPGCGSHDLLPLGDFGDAEIIVSRDLNFVLVFIIVAADHDAKPTYNIQSTTANMGGKNIVRMTVPVAMQIIRPMAMIRSDVRTRLSSLL